MIPKLKQVWINSQTIPWYDIGVIARDSIHKNFDVGGRPKWPKRKVAQKHPILMKTRALKFSHYIAPKNHGVLVGNKSLIYNATQNYGDDSRNIKKREHVKLQKIDIRTMKAAIKKHLKKKM